MKVDTVYKTPEGKTHKILMFDELNKMAYIHIEGALHRWVHENEYCTWVVNNTAEMPKIYIPDMPSQMTEEQAESVNYDLETNEVIVVEEKPKKKTTKKKKDDTNS